MSENRNGNGEPVSCSPKGNNPPLDLDFGPKTRKFTGLIAALISIIAIAASLFHLYTAQFGAFFCSYSTRYPLVVYGGA